MAIMVVYHAIHPDFSKAFDDNGDEDEFNPNPDPTNPNGIFWGKTKEDLGYFPTPDGGCVHAYNVCKYRLWIKFGCKIDDRDC